MKEISFEEAKQLELDIIVDITNFCDSHGLRYCSAYGTLIGAIRHRGFIPWDDDIDLGMMRSDYERLIELLKEDENLVLQYGSNGRHKCFVKIRHKVFERIFIDIFPYDMYFSKTNSKEKAKLHNLIKKVSDGLKHSLIKENNPEKLYKKLKKITNKKILKNKIVKEEDKPSLFWGIDFPHGWKNRVYDWEDIFPLTEVRYENFSFPAPANVHNVLSNIYGEYMKLPKDAYPRHMHINGLNDLEKEKLYKLIEISKNL